MRTFLFLYSAIILVSCSSAPSGPESGLSLPSNVVESVEERYSATEDPDTSLKKAVYLDTITNEKVAERHFYKSKKVYIENLFKNGHKNGPSMAFRDSTGLPWSLHTYKNDTLNGPYKVWHESGNLRIEGQYIMGVKSGNWRFFDEQGQLLREINFADSTNQIAG